jgi:hypothetical protein
MEEELVEVVDLQNHQDQNAQEQIANQNIETNEQEIIAAREIPSDMIENEEESQIRDTKIQIVDFQTEWSQLSENEKTLGIIAPVWLKDRYGLKIICTIFNFINY